jgi:hypothetical protein
MVGRGKDLEWQNATGDHHREKSRSTEDIIQAFLPALVSFGVANSLGSSPRTAFKSPDNIISKSSARH